MGLSDARRTSVRRTVPVRRASAYNEVMQRLESTRVGQLLISVFVLITVGSMVVWNLPASKLQREGLRLAGPYVRATGLDQNWAVFAPNPYRGSFELRARLTFADGTQTEWDPPAGGAAIGAYWDFRWGKWVEWTIDRRHRDLCPGTAAYAAAHGAPGDATPVQVDVIARRRPNPPPGADTGAGGWQETVVCATRITESEGGG
jgi:hypothetical protein